MSGIILGVIFSICLILLMGLAFSSMEKYNDELKENKGKCFMGPQEYFPTSQVSKSKCSHCGTTHSSAVCPNCGSMYKE